MSSSGDLQLDCLVPSSSKLLSSPLNLDKKQEDDEDQEGKKKVKKSKDLSSSSSTSSISSRRSSGTTSNGSKGSKKSSKGSKKSSSSKGSKGSSKGSKKSSPSTSTSSPSGGAAAVGKSSKTKRLDQLKELTTVHQFVGGITQSTSFDFFRVVVAIYKLSPERQVEFLHHHVVIRHMLNLLENEFGDIIIIRDDIESIFNDHDRDYDHSEVLQNKWTVWLKKEKELMNSQVYTSSEGGVHRLRALISDSIANHGSYLMCIPKISIFLRDIINQYHIKVVQQLILPTPKERADLIKCITSKDYKALFSIGESKHLFQNLFRNHSYDNKGHIVPSTNVNNEREPGNDGGEEKEEKELDGDYEKMQMCISLRMQAIKFLSKKVRVVGGKKTKKTKKSDKSDKKGKKAKKSEKGKSEKGKKSEDNKKGKEPKKPKDVDANDNDEKKDVNVNIHLWKSLLEIEDLIDGALSSEESAEVNNFDSYQHLQLNAELGDQTSIFLNQVIQDYNITVNEYPPL